jgi:D-3-phosphoglycerate dehydrogenase
VAARVLVKERIGEPGVARLRAAGLDVDLGLDWEDGELAERIGAYDGILIRSSTKLTADLIERADRLRVIGRAGVGVDNVDVPAATKRGIVVANAPQSNVVTAAEHTMALLLALARNIPQADASLHAGRWDRAKYSGVELYDKTLGIVGFGRIGQLVAERARGFGMRVVAYDPYVGAERYRDLGVDRAETSDDLYGRADFVTIHLPKTPDTEGWLDADAFAKMRDGVRVLNVARGPLVVDEDLRAAIDSGKVAGAALDVFAREPITDHPLFGYPNVVVTPHLGASTAEAQDRAGVQTAEQVVAALTGGVVSTAVNIPAVSAEDMEALGPFLPLCRRLGRIAAALAATPSLERVEAEFLGRIAERDTRLLTLSVLNGLLAGRIEEEVNLVNAPALADERGIQVSERREATARDYSDLVRITVVCGDERCRVVGTTLGHLHRPHLLEAWGQRFNLQIDDPHLALFRYSDVPGMVGRVGTRLGECGVNISAAAVGRHAPGDDGTRSDLAVMAVTTDSPVPADVLEEIAGSEGFISGRAIPLGDQATAPVLRPAS